MVTTMPNAGLNNVNLNSLMSQYAQTYGYNKTDVIIQKFNEQIYDGAPAQFPLLTLLNMKSTKTVDSDEHFFSESGWQRNPVQVNGAGAAGVSYPAQQTVPITSFDDVSEDMNVVYPNGQVGNVVSLNPSAGTVNIQPLTNSTLPTVSSGDTLAFMATIEPDGADGFKPYFRMSHVTKYNFVQQMPFAMKWGKMEMEKYKRANQFQNYMSMQFEKFYQQARVGLENALWQGIRGEFKTASGVAAKTMGGIDYFMTQAGSPSVTTPAATMDLALQQLVYDCQYEMEGATKFLFGAPRLIQKLSSAFKDDKTRYAPNDKIADLGLDQIKFGGINVVPVGVQRFEDSASFPVSWAKRLYLCDLSHLNVCQFLAPEFGNALNRASGLPVNKEEMWISYTQSIELFNPLAWGKILVS